MIGLAEIVVVAVVVGLIYVSQRRGGRSSESSRERQVGPDDRTTITVPRHLATWLVSSSLAVAVALGTTYMGLPPWLGAVAAGLAAGSAATALAAGRAGRR